MMLTERNKQKLRGYILSHMLPVAQSVGSPEIVREEFKNLLEGQEVTFVHWSPYKGSIGVGQGIVCLKFNKQIIKDYFNFYRRNVVRQSFLEFNVAQDLLTVLAEALLPYDFTLFEIGEKTLYSYLLYGVNGVKRGHFFAKAMHKRLLPYVNTPVERILEEESMDSLLHSIQGMGLINEHTLNFRRKLKFFVLSHQTAEGMLSLENNLDSINQIDEDPSDHVVSHLA
jgi:hypothetical protein